jgi:polysaccharide biosynthesis transport protein
LSERRQELKNKLDENRAQYSQSIQKAKELEKQLIQVGLKSDSALSKTGLTQDVTYQALLKQYNDLDSIYNQQRIRFTDDNPIVVSDKEKRDRALSALRNRAQQVLKQNVGDKDLIDGSVSVSGNSLAQVLASKLADIQSELAAGNAEYESSLKHFKQIKQDIDRLPTLQEEYGELQRQYNLKSKQFTDLNQKLEDLKLADAEQVIPWTRLDPPEKPQIPIFPNVPQQLALGGIGSLLLGVLGAVGAYKIKNNLNTRVDSPDALKAMTGMPILTLVPKVDGLEQIVMRGGAAIQTTKSKSKNYSYWNFIEAMRMLVLDIGLMSDDEHRVGKIIAMTSAVPKEGKSTISFHTSITLAELGYKVLLVDVDLHKSSISRLCRSSALFQDVDCTSDDGLSDALLKGDNWETLIKKSPTLKLDVLFSGPLSVNSIALLNSPRFKRLIDRWKQEYDYIIFDTPPIVGVSDARLIATMVDGLVYIVSLNVAQRRTIDRAIEIISSIQTPLLGLVINRVENKYSGYGENYTYYNELREQNVVANISKTT